MKWLSFLFLFTFGIPSYFAQSLSSHYVQMKDGVRLAVDVYLPDTSNHRKWPTLVQFERYWRSSLDRKSSGDTPELRGRAKYFSDNGYAIVIVDTRGSGASFGTRLSEYSPQEVMDAGQVLNWIVDQSWSNGKTGAYGTSYTGTTAELVCATQHPSIKAVIPGWSDFDIYRSPVRPYGLLASKFIKKWGTYVRLLDRNKKIFLGGGIYPVNEDSLKLALKDHKKNFNVKRSTIDGEYRNSATGAYNYEECSVVHWEKEIEASNVPMLVLASWMDAGTVEGAIQRLEHFSNPQKVLLMATAHGGWCNASPFVVGDSLMTPNPTFVEQNKIELDFFDYYLKGIDSGVDEWPMIRYYNMGEEKYRTSNVWPIKGTTETDYYFQKNGGLAHNKPLDSVGVDDYKVDFSVYTSEKNRWTTQMGGPVLNLNERNEMDEKMLVYTTAPVTKDVQITGTPIVTVELASTHSDGALLVYLEDVDEHGKSTYITEGGLRLIYRKELSEDSGAYNLHSFNEEDALPMTRGRVETVKLKMWPTSVLIRKGHSIRIAIAGADKSTFDRTPKFGTPTLSIQRNALVSSFVTLPIVIND